MARAGRTAGARAREGGGRHVDTPSLSCTHAAPHTLLLPAGPSPAQRRPPHACARSAALAPTQPRVLQRHHHRRAHNTLFIAELASQQHRFPVHLRAGKAGKATGRSGARGAGASSDEDEGGSSSTATASEGGAAGEAGAAGAAGAGGRGKGKRGAGPAAGSGTGTDLQPGKRVRKARVWS